MNAFHCTISPKYSPTKCFVLCFQQCNQNDFVNIYEDSSQEVECMDDSYQEAVHRMPTKSKVAQIIEAADDRIGKFTNEILHLDLNQKQSNAVFTFCIELVGEIRYLNKQLLDQNKTMSPDEIVELSADFITDKLSSFQTTYKYKSNVAKNSLFVPPQQKTLGTRFEMKRIKSTDIAVPRVIQSKMQYVPLLDTIRSLFNRQDFYDTFFNYNKYGKHRCSDGVYEDFCCGDLYKKTELYQNNEFCLQIQISYDDFELCSPLKSKENIHKVCGVYFTIRNLPTQYLSQVDNIFLLALCYSDDLKNKQCDFNNIWRMVVPEIKVLEKEGITLQCGTNIKGSISFGTFDNLGAHVALGFANSFSCKNNCRFCENTSQEYQEIFNENQCHLRTKESYTQHVENIESMTKIDYKKTCGIRSHCELNELEYFHIMKNKSIDIMHDINEGVIPKFMHTLLSSLIQSKLFNEKEIVRKIQYFDFGDMYKRNIPSMVALGKENLGQNATQSKCLFFHIPYIFYEYRDDSRFADVWSIMGCLLRITQTIYSKKISERDLISLEEDIFTFVHTYKTKLYRNITPKIHFMIHYPNVIRQMGPPIHMSMIRFESKHKHLKDLVKQNNNFQNILLSIAMKHQEKLVAVKNSFQDKSETGAQKKVNNVDFLKFKNIPQFQFADSSTIKTTKWFLFNGYRYKQGILISYNNFLNEIRDILLVHDEIYFVCVQHEIVEFNTFLNSFQIRQRETDPLTLVQFYALKNKKPYSKKIWIIKYLYWLKH